MTCLQVVVDRAEGMILRREPELGAARLCADELQDTGTVCRAAQCIEALLAQPRLPIMLREHLHGYHLAVGTCCLPDAAETTARFQLKQRDV